MSRPVIRVEVRRQIGMRGYPFTAKLTTRGYMSTGYGRDVRAAIDDVFTCRKGRALLTRLESASQEPGREK